MEKVNYSTHERTIEQFKALELKAKGYEITRLIEQDYSGEDVVVSFGYTPSPTLVIKTSTSKLFSSVDDNDYEYIYWN